MAIFIGAVVVFAHVRAAAQEKIRIAWAGDSPANSPVWVVQEKGLLKKNGLAGEVIRITNSPTAVQALLAGELDVVVTSVTTLVSSRIASVSIFESQTSAPWARAELRRFSVQLRGRIA